MATALEIITNGYREANFKSTTGVLTAEEQTEGLALLQSIVDAVAGMIVGIRRTPWYVPTPQRTASIAANYPAMAGDVGRPLNNLYPPSNVRLFMRNPDNVVVNLQYQPEDGAVVEYVDVGHEGIVTLDANGALFGLTGSEDTVEIAPLFPAGRNTPRRWLFRGDYGSWLEITTLTLTSEMPFPRQFDDYFSTTMAIRLSPRFGSEPRTVTLVRNQEMQQFIRAQWVQSAEVVHRDLGVPTMQTYENSYRPEDFGRGDL
jgi:hypothetical protein